MMVYKRLIPILLLCDGALVKTVNFKVNRSHYIGDPINAVKIFNEKYVDELVLLDIRASKIHSDIDFKLLEDIAAECFIPLAYGGGIKTIEEMDRIFNLGIEKVILNSSIINDQRLLIDAVERYGSQSVVASIDIKKNWLGQERVYDSAMEKITTIHVESLLNKHISAGAGEIYLNFVDREGLQIGCDITRIRQYTAGVNVPVVITGGVGSLEDVRKVYDQTKVKAVGVGSLCVFKGVHNAVLISYPGPDEIAAIGSGSGN